MIRKIIAISAVISTALFFSLAWAAPKMNPGNWKITTKTEMPGMPAQSMTHTQCVTNDDLVPMGDDANKDCRVTDIKTSGNTVSWKITCGGQGGQMDGTGQVTYEGDKMHGVMNMTMKSYGTKVKNTLSGYRIGDCNATKAGTSGKTSPVNSGIGNEVGGVLAEDTKDVGRAAKDEAKQSVIDEVREGVRSVIKGLFD